MFVSWPTMCEVSVWCIHCLRWISSALMVKLPHLDYVYKLLASMAWRWGLVNHDIIMSVMVCSWRMDRKRMDDGWGRPGVRESRKVSVLVLTHFNEWKCHIRSKPHPYRRGDARRGWANHTNSYVAYGWTQPRTIKEKPPQHDKSKIDLGSNTKIHYSHHLFKQLTVDGLLELILILRWCTCTHMIHVLRRLIQSLQAKHTTCLSL